MTIAQEIRSVRRRAKKQTDPICGPCCNVGVCRGNCPPLIWIDGDKQSREVLLRDDVSGFSADGNYNDVLSEQIESARVRKRAVISAMRDDRKAAIAVLLDNDSRNFTIRQIARILGCTERSIWRWK